MLRVPSARLRLVRWIGPDGRRSCRDCGIGVIFWGVAALISKHGYLALKMEEQGAKVTGMDQFESIVEGFRQFIRVNLEVDD